MKNYKKRIQKFTFKLNLVVIIMQDLSFVGEPFINGVLLIVMGLVSLLFGLERVLDKVPGIGGKIDVDDFDTKVMKYLTIIFSAVAVVWALLLMVAENVNYHWFTMVLLFTYSIVLLSHPIKNLEGWKMFLLLLPIIIITFVAFYFSGNREINLPGDISIPMWTIFLLILFLFVILFLIIFFVEESAIDPFLAIVGWSPWVVVLSIIVILQGLALILSDDIGGIAFYLSDLISNEAADIGG
ncbi:MAG: hypothetical protein HeimC3_35050 [Candidatus Heimdallarchaeota archaeon LC_3]|nr:MAG: hypothetical protein HeimC3_35050 [Candidatus Heimdallarchaeota archaeon LC_3]